MANTDPPVPAPVEQSLRVYNKSPYRSFIHGAFTLAPSSFLSVPESVAKIWLEGYADTVVEAGVAQKELGGLTSELAAAKARIAELEAAAAAKAPATKPKGKTADVV